MNLDLEHVQAGRDVKVQVYLVNRGPVAHQAYLQGPQGAWDSRIGSRETVEDLRTKLLYGTHQPKRPVALTVTGTLFPCALLSSGWWEKHVPAGKAQRVAWRDEVQRWLFYGFDLWGPSWDFTWQFDDANARPDRPYYIAQLGDGDEANSLPVLLPAEKARRYQEFIGAQQGSERWGGLEAEVTGVLGHRKHFTGALAPGALELFGGLLDYCLWLDADTKDHRIMPLSRQTDIYSGYLWKCVAPAAWVDNRIPSLNDVFFLWEHTNFASPDAVQYNLEALEHKAEFVRRKYGDLVLVHKSSWLVPGTPHWDSQQIYGMLLGQRGVAF